MLIKRSQVQTALAAHPPEAPQADRSDSAGHSPKASARHAAPEPTRHHEHAWDLEAFQAGLVQDRRGGRRRSGSMYRRVEDKEIISQAEQEANAIRERAAIEGFEQGVHQATQQTEALRGLLIQLLEGKQSALQSLESDIVPIAVAVAEKILQREALCDTELVTGLVRQTIMRVDKDVKRIMVKVHPDEVATVKAFLDPNPFPDVDAQLLVLEDPMVDRGSCTVETASGLVDASFSTQLAIVRRVLGVQESSDHPTDSSPDTLPLSHEPPHGD